MSEADDNINHGNQLNPDHDAYWQSRGYDGRPDESRSGSGEDDDWEPQWMPEED